MSFVAPMKMRATVILQHRAGAYHHRLGRPVRPGLRARTQVQLRFLKVRWSDFIFSAMSQEFGFVGTVSIILLQLFVIYRCLRTARQKCGYPWALIAYGVATMLAFQAMVNIGVNLKLLPATGLTLPFVSYGGSSLFTNLLAIGLVQSVILRTSHLNLKSSRFSNGSRGNQVK